MRFILNGLVIGMAFTTHSVFADRTINIHPFVNNGSWLMTNLHNPSSVSQRFNIVYTAMGDYYFDDASSHTGGDAFDCPGSKPQTCTLKTTYNTLATGQLLQATLYVRSSVSAGNVANNSGVKGLITVVGDRGYLLSTVTVDISGGGTIMVPVASGHPF